ncbi:protein RDM16-like isoform X1 [Rutidosis leptorrhynchoides]|uniref:protein RDM16-like isoform X1 n=2 Tax=Rutidosis leptorrhynchoides TaxID=125765 RepID=UPI003A98D60A
MDSRSSRKHRDSDPDPDPERDKHHRSKYRDTDGEDRRRRSKRERSEDIDERVKREKSYERETSKDRELSEKSVDTRRHHHHHHKRKDRDGDSDDEDRFYEAREKRTRVSDERKERRRFEDKAAAAEDDRDREERKERRKFEDKVKKKEEIDSDNDGIKKGNLNGDKTKSDVKDELFGGSNANGGALESHNKAFGTPRETSLAPSQPPSSSKVSLISSKHENEGVNSNRSHEVPGKSSTDGNSADAAGKSGGISLDVLSKAKATLLKRKELAEKMKKIPMLNKGVNSSTERIGQISTKEVSKAPSSSGMFPGPPQPVTIGSTAPMQPLGSGVPQLAGLTAPKYEAVKRAQELAAKMGFRQDPEFAPLINMFPGQMPPDVTLQPKPAKAPVLRLDHLGREVDEHGNVVNIPKLNNLSTLKVNINKQKKDAFQILKPELEVDPDKNPHFDPRMGIDKVKLLRPKKMTFQFVEEGKWAKEAEMIKLKSQFGEAQAREFRAKQAQLAKAKAEPDINPNLIEVSERIIIKEKPKDPIPDVEWWDVPFLESGNYGNITEGGLAEDILKKEKVTLYVEHPRPIEPPAEPAPPPPQPLKLTQKERKKLRTQRRLATEQNRQEMIRQGLLEPPKPKVKMSNLMRVLGSEATQDPTRLEMEIRSAAAEREQAHADRNIARKLTPDERREKKERKLFDDNNTLETIVSVYKVNDLSHPQTRFKVDVNAQENRLSGCAVMSEGVCVVVVEGGNKSIKRYQKLMLKRINWAAAVKEENEDEDGDDEKPTNKCVLVWQGSVAKPSFHRFLVHECRTETAARKVFADAGVVHYWDLAVNFTDEV